jgi:hypothetical protein
LSIEINPEKHPSLKVKPHSIYFGGVKQGSESNAKLIVSGGPCKLSINNDRLRVNPATIRNEETEVQVTFSGGIEGELIWDYIIFQTDTNEIKVPVIGYWEKGAAQISPPIYLPPIIPDQISHTRATKGHACSFCSRNFTYDVNSHTWEQCNCNWDKKMIRISLRIYKEFRIGIKSFPSYVKEMGNLITGKEKW